MRIALPVWQGRVSPVFDTAGTLLVIEPDGTGERRRTEAHLGDVSAPRRVARLASLGVQTLICGAISQPLASMIVARGIRLIPFTSGSVEDVLSAFETGRLGGGAFLMPGCRRPGGRRHRGGGRGMPGRRSRFA